MEAKNANAMKCCGAERNTRFCPECGRELRINAGAGLIVHLRKVISSYEKAVLDERGKLQSAIQQQPDNENLHRSYEMGIASREATREKWQTWLKWVLDKAGADAKEQ